MEPLISIQLVNGESAYHPGDELQCDYQVDAVDPKEVQAVEASALWYTEGKGDQDMAVHFFERHVPSEENGFNAASLRRLCTTLPNSPLSYDGQIVKIHWCVRVRAFLRRGKSCFFERPFRLIGGSQ